MFLSSIVCPVSRGSQKDQFKGAWTSLCRRSMGLKERFWAGAIFPAPAQPWRLPDSLGLCKVWCHSSRYGCAFWATWLLALHILIKYRGIYFLLNTNTICLSCQASFGLAGQTSVEFLGLNPWFFMFRIRSTLFFLSFFPLCLHLTGDPVPGLTSFPCVLRLSL